MIEIIRARKFLSLGVESNKTAAMNKSPPEKF